MKWITVFVLGIAATQSAAQDQGSITFDSGDPKFVGEQYITGGGCLAHRAPQMPEKFLNGASASRILQSIYIHQVADAIEQAGGECSCEIRFPTWNAAVAEYQERFSNLPDDSTSTWVRQFAYNDRGRVTNEVGDICYAAGVR